MARILAWRPLVWLGTISLRRLSGTGQSFWRSTANVQAGRARPCLPLVCSHSGAGRCVVADQATYSALATGTGSAVAAGSGDRCQRCRRDVLVVPVGADRGYARSVTSARRFGGRRSLAVAAERVSRAQTTEIPNRPFTVFGIR